MTIKAIFYDLDGTLRMNEPDGWQAFTAYASELGLDSTPQDRLRAARWEHYYFAESPELHVDEVAFPDRQAFWTNFGIRQLQVLGASPEQAAELAPKVTGRMYEGYHPADIIPEGVFETLQALKGQGFRLGVMSNRKTPYDEYLAELGLSDYFNPVVYAGQTGFLKPDPGVFHYLLGKAGVSADESIYVGDNYYADVLGARSAGMPAVLLDIHGLFEAADCPVIKTHNQLLGILEEKQGR